jgi:hypothetical protein
MRANADKHNSHNTQHTRVKQIKLCCMRKVTQSSQECSRGHITPKPSKNRCGWCLFAYGVYKLDETRLDWTRLDQTRLDATICDYSASEAPPSDKNGPARVLRVHGTAARAAPIARLPLCSLPLTTAAPTGLSYQTKTGPSRCFE